jgi:hypothetical protein
MRAAELMKLVAVSIVKNEADIIEAFVRHTRTWVDQHLIFDHDSTDGTREILAALAREDPAITLFSDTALGNLQQARSNYLTRLAVTQYGADWVLPLDADEFVVAADRTALEQALGPSSGSEPVSVCLVNYYPAKDDNAAERNPVLRLRHRVYRDFVFKKVFSPRALVLDPEVVAGKGSHALTRAGAPLPDRSAPEDIYLAHFPQRTLGQQVTRLVTAELQKLSAGSALAGLDTHYRAHVDFLREYPDLFAETLYKVPGRLELAPINYRGGSLRYSTSDQDWMRAVRSLLPFLEKLARSHGELVDRVPKTESSSQSSTEILSLPLSAIRPPGGSERLDFAGFSNVEGMGPPEGPFPDMLLPRFRWGMAPETLLQIDPELGRIGRLELEVLTFTENQVMTIFLNETELHRIHFSKVDQKERLSLPLPLRAGFNELAFRYEKFTQQPSDARRLAVIFTSLRVI